MIYFFKKENSWLSNFSKCDIRIKDIVYPSVENAYMSCKNPSLEWKIFCRDNEPSTVKKKSKKIDIRIDWDDVKIKAMKYCLVQKYNQEPFKTLLLETKDENIVEGNYWNDIFWGVDLKSNPNIGENHLGRLIMNIRDNLKDKYND